jgi:hypothetical protein
LGILGLETVAGSARDEAQDIGSDTLTGVNDGDYKVPFTFTASSTKHF